MWRRPFDGFLLRRHSNQLSWTIYTKKQQHCFGDVVVGGDYNEYDYNYDYDYDDYDDDENDDDDYDDECVCGNVDRMTNEGNEMTEIDPLLESFSFKYFRFIWN